MTEDLQSRAQTDSGYFKTPAKDIFLISPVRISTPEINSQAKKIIEKHETNFNSVYYPLKHTYQKNDSTGLRIINDNRDAILNSKWVEILYKPESWGSVFDLGMSFMAGKQLHIANLSEVFEFPLVKSPEDRLVKEFILNYAYGKELISQGVLYARAQELKQALPKKPVFEIEWKGKNPKNLLELGMAYVSQYFHNTQIALANPEQVQRTQGKSFENILLEFHADYLRSQGE